MKRFQRSVMAAVALLALAGEMIAQQSSKSVVIHAGHVLDVKTGKMLADQALIIEDGKITRVGAFAERKLPQMLFALICRTPRYCPD